MRYSQLYQINGVHLIDKITLMSISRATIYKVKKAIVEPAFGQIKERRGFRRFRLRGRDNVAVGVEAGLPHPQPTQAIPLRMKPESGLPAFGLDGG
jgi:hypothetical protein